MICVPAYTYAPITHHQHHNWWEWRMSFSQGCVLLVVYVFRHITYHNWMHCSCVIHSCIAYMHVTLHTHRTHYMSATHIIIMWWVDCGTPGTSYTHTLYQSPHPIWHMQGTYHEWHVHTHQLDVASLVGVMILGVAYTHATHICVLYVYTMLKLTHR